MVMGGIMIDRPPFTFGVTGTLYNTNTLEEFKRIDKNKLFHQATQKVCKKKKEKDEEDEKKKDSRFGGRRSDEESGEHE